MAKNLKLNVKNAQLAEALKLGKIKKKKAETPPPAKKKASSKARSLTPLSDKPAEKEVKQEETKPVETPAAPPKKKTQAKDAPTPLPPKKKEEEKPVVKAEPAPKPVPAAPVKAGGIGFIRPGTDKLARQKAREKSAREVKAAPAADKKKPQGSKPSDDRNRSGRTTTPPPQSDRPKKTTYAKENRPSRRTILTEQTTFDSRHRQGLRSHDDEGWRRRRPGYKQKQKRIAEIPVVRPSSLSVKLPITIKDLAAAMKYKAAELISKLFMQGITVTINDQLDDETIVGILGSEFGCEITIDTSEEERLQITGKTIAEEIADDEAASLEARAPVVAFMGHVDHGKTSLIDKIRESNIASGEAGAITQHIGAFRANVKEGALTILDTPGHEAFTAMRSRGATVTDIVVLVVAGDEGIKPQTDEAIQQAIEAKVPMVVAINKCDKPDFNADNVYRQLADRELLPESWGGDVLTVNVSAHTAEGIPNLLEVLYLQSEMLELKANPKKRARGTVLESELKKGLGINATLLVQNGTLKLGDALVIDNVYGRVKTMHDENGRDKKSASPSYPVEITGISDQPEAGCEFIVVGSEKEAKKLCEERLAKQEHRQLMKKRNLESFMARSEELIAKKVLNIILKADVQGSLEAVRESLLKIKSEKAEVNIIASDVGEIAESDIEYAQASNAVIIGFTQQFKVTLSR